MGLGRKSQFSKLASDELGPLQNKEGQYEHLMTSLLSLIYEHKQCTVNFDVSEQYNTLT